MPSERTKDGKLHEVIGEGQPVIGTNSRSHSNVRSDNRNKPAKPPHKTSKQQRKQVAKLIGKICMLTCLINGVTTEMLLDSGAQVSVVGQTWIENTLPDAQIQPMSSLLGEDFYATAANGTPRSPAW